MVLEYGMSESLGPLSYETRRRNMLGMHQVTDAEQSRHSEETLQEIDREIRRIVDEEHGRVRELLTREEVAERLLEKEVIEGDELVEILEEHAPNRGRKKGRGRTPVEG
jgi:cell division protease FtsH